LKSSGANSGVADRLFRRDLHTLDELGDPFVAALYILPVAPAEADGDQGDGGP
jgi:hypothetical protein